MKMNLMLLVSGFFCMGLPCNESFSSNLSKKTLENLHKTAIRPGSRQVTGIDQKNDRVFVKDNRESKLKQDDLDALKKKSFIAGNRRPIKLDADEDIITFETDDK